MSDSLSIEGLAVDLRIDGRLRRVVHSVDLEIPVGAAVGLIGESGSGKSVTARAVARLLPRTARVTGSVSLDGRDLLALGRSDLRRFRTKDLAMIFQDPRAHINPVRRIEDFMTEALRTNLGVRARAARIRARDLLESVGIHDADRVLRLYPHQLSGGMLQRVMIASVLAIEPRLILADEPTTALDVTRQAEIVRMLNRLRRERGMGLLFITHDIELAAAICDEIAVMYAGSLVEVCSAEKLRAEARHPYTRALLGARPNIAARADRLQAIPGRPLAGYEVPEGCSFADRCAFVHEACRDTTEELRRLGDARVRCRRAEEIEAGTASRREVAVDGC